MLELTPLAAHTQVAVAVVAVVIAAIVVIYISVGTNLTIAINVGVVVAVAVTVISTDPEPRLASKPKNMLAEDVDIKSKIKADRALASRILLGKRIQALDPQMMQDTERAARVALILGQGQFMADASRQLIHEEIDAFVSAAEELKIIAIPAETRKLVMDSMKRLAIRTAGLEPAHG